MVDTGAPFAKSTRILLYGVVSMVHPPSSNKTVDNHGTVSMRTPYPQSFYGIQYGVRSTTAKPNCALEPLQANHFNPTPILGVWSASRTGPGTPWTLGRPSSIVGCNHNLLRKIRMYRAHRKDSGGRDGLLRALTYGYAGLFLVGFPCSGVILSAWRV